MNEKNNILRAKDIIPARPDASASENEDVFCNIPQFNLATDIMAGQRRLTAARRQRTSSENRANEKPAIQISRSSSPKSFLSYCDPVIAEIVAADIEHLCKGGSFR